jgi:hypothetical protein
MILLPPRGIIMTLIARIRLYFWWRKIIRNIKPSDWIITNDTTKEDYDKIFNDIREEFE